MNSNEKDYMEIDLMRLLKALLHRAWAIVIAVIAGALIAFAYAALLITPLYKSKALLYVNNSSISLGSTSVSISTGELSAPKALVGRDIFGKRHRNFPDSRYQPRPQGG